MFCSPPKFYPCGPRQRVSQNQPPTPSHFQNFFSHLTPAAVHHHAAIYFHDPPYVPNRSQLIARFPFLYSLPIFNMNVPIPCAPPLSPPWRPPDFLPSFKPQLFITGLFKFARKTAPQPRNLAPLIPSAPTKAEPIPPTKPLPGVRTLSFPIWATQFVDPPIFPLW